MKLRGKRSCIELNKIIECVCSGSCRGVRGEEIINLCIIFLSVKGRLKEKKTDHGSNITPSRVPQMTETFGRL